MTLRRLAPLLALVSACVGPERPVDGGWRLVLERRIEGKYEDLSFPTATDGWLIASAGDILHTADGGDTWEVQATGLGHLRSLEMLDARTGFAGTLDGTLLRTEDGGQRWDDITDSLPHAPRGFCGMDHVGDDVHLVGRFAGEAADHYWSTDGGRTWAHQDLSPLAQGLVEILFLDDVVGFIGGMAPSTPSGVGPAVILKTTDGGANWRVVFRHEGGRGFAWKLFEASDTRLVAALQTEDGVLRVARSDDRGEAWELREVDIGQRRAPGLQAVGFLDAQRGWVGGFFDGMYATTDGGASWTRVPSPDHAINRFERGGGGLVTASRRGVLRLPSTPQ